ncbi:glycine receptor subunit alpha-1-like [Uloborus diversus]|uniref:glycine receptor subunit alpha-1-like n=1 Tax=Uloborus diversus TaxID=327109 RepID=UPI0024094BBA|nr:glycine receptor subunit alpha-1-like [Uloborus diversus]
MAQFITLTLLTITMIALLLLPTALSFRSGERPPIKLSDVVGPGYDNFQPPRIEGKPAHVSIQIEILNIRSVDVTVMSFIADIFLYKTWKDPRLRYPASKNLEQVALHPDWIKHLWTPDIYFHNAIEGKVLTTVIPYIYMFLKNDSTVLFGARLSLQFSCDMLLHNFPHDTQTCDIIVKSLTHTLSEMELHWNEKDSISVGDYIILPQFEFSEPHPAACDEYLYVGKHGSFACLRGEIKLSRRAGYYVINIYIPTILIVFMSMLTFWIPVDAVPGRVTLGVTSLLTIITKQYQASLPSVSYVVALNVWLSVCIGFVFCSLLEYAAVVALLNHKTRLQNKVRGDEPEVGGWKWAKSVFQSSVDKIDVHNIDRLCRIIFPVIFCLHCITYYSLYAK